MLMLILSISGTVLMVSYLLWLFQRERKKNRYSPFTEKMLRTPGYTLNYELDDLAETIMIPFIVIALLPVTYFFIAQDLGFEIKIFSGLIVIGVMIWELRKVRNIFLKSRKLKLGLDGEVYAGQELNCLMRQGAWVYHDIPYKYGNIDHIIVSKAGIFAVETKTFRKPVNDKGTKEAKVFVKNGSLVFPHFTTSKPIEQAKRHSEYVKKFLLEETGYNYPVYAVVALPGWYVDSGKNKNGFLVVNPKRGKGIERYLQDKKIPQEKLDRAVFVIEKFARNVISRTDLTDPDADKKYGLFLKRKPEEHRL